MKLLYTLLAVLFTAQISAQIPAGYYDEAIGTGFQLKSQLKQIINDVNDGFPNEFIHIDQGDNLDNLYGTSDLDAYYENDGTILDIYSENPTGMDPYNYTFPADECMGNFSSEGECYNKEHVIPKSVYNENSPMVDDAHAVIPVDGRVNGLRGSFPFGVVDDNLLISQGGVNNPTMNGSKAGGNLNSGYSAGFSGTVFEPIDEFKGDIARIYFYFVTRYEDQVDNWSSYTMFDGSNNKALDDPFLSILLTWHTNDPVSQREIDRNNIVFNYQNNRNPFIDNPSYANMIWGSTSMDTEDPTDPTNLVASNPTNTSIDLSWTAATDNIAVTSYDVYINSVFSFNTGNPNTNTTVTGLVPDTFYCFTITARDATANTSGFSNESCEVTLNTGSDLNCTLETFENMPPNASQYTNVMWVGNNGFSYTATDARTDQTLDGRAITIRNGNLQYTDNFSDAIESLTVTTQRVFSGGSGSFDLLVNGNLVGTIPYNDTPTTTTIPININPFNSFEITNNSTTSNRVMFDNLSWTCGLLSSEEFTLDAIKIYPNPVKNELLVNIKNNLKTDISIYTILGEKVLTTTIENKGFLNLKHLNNGMYILKMTQGENVVTKKIIKE